MANHVIPMSLFPYLRRRFSLPRLFYPPPIRRCQQSSPHFTDIRASGVKALCFQVSHYLHLRLLLFFFTDFRKTFPSLLCSQFSFLLYLQTSPWNWPLFPWPLNVFKSRDISIDCYLFQRLSSMSASRNSPRLPAQIRDKVIVEDKWMKGGT